jgi:hypothetical protein
VAVGRLGAQDRPVVGIRAVEAKNDHGPGWHRASRHPGVPRITLKPRSGTVDDPVAEEPLCLPDVAVRQVGGLGLDRVEVDVTTTGLQRVAVDDPVNLAAFDLVAVRQVRRRLDEVPVDVRGRRLERQLRDRRLSRVPAVRRQRRPAPHAGQAAVLRVGDLEHLVGRIPQPDLVLRHERDALPEARLGA